MLPRSGHLLSLGGLLLGLATPRASVCGQDPAEPAQGTEPVKPEEPKPEWRGDPYLLDYDPVSKGRLGPVEKQEKRLYQGREFRFSSMDDAEAFEASPSSYIPAVDARLIRDQSDFYPLDTCLVSGEKLGGTGVSLIYRNRLVRFSSQQHVSTFRGDTGKYIAILDQAVLEKQGPGYAKKTCAVCSKGIEGESSAPVDYLIGNRLIRVCSSKCTKDIERDPRKYMYWFPAKDQRTRPEVAPPDGEGPR